MKKVLYSLVVIAGVFMLASCSKLYRSYYQIENNLQENVEVTIYGGDMWKEWDSVNQEWSYCVHYLLEQGDNLTSYELDETGSWGPRTPKQLESLLVLLSDSIKFVRPSDSAAVFFINPWYSETVDGVFDFKNWIVSSNEIYQSTCVFQITDALFE